MQTVFSISRNGYTPASFISLKHSEASCAEPFSAYPENNSGGERWRSSLEAVPMLLVLCLPHHTLGWRIRNWHIAAVRYLEHSCCTVKKKNKCSMSSLEFNPSIGASTSLVCNQKSKTVTRHSLLEGKTHSKEMMRYM